MSKPSVTQNYLHTADTSCVHFSSTPICNPDMKPDGHSRTVWRAGELVKTGLLMVMFSVLLEHLAAWIWKAFYEMQVQLAAGQIRRKYLAMAHGWMPCSREVLASVSWGGGHPTRSGAAHELDLEKRWDWAWGSGRWQRQGEQDVVSRPRPECVRGACVEPSFCADLHRPVQGQG